MKKSILLLLAILPVAALTSCLGDDEVGSTSTFSATMVQIKSNGSSATLSTGNYRYEFDYTNALVDITIYDESLYGAAFTLPDLPLRTSTTTPPGFLFSASSITPVDANGNAISGLAISNFYGHYYNTLDLRFTVTTSSGSTLNITAIPSSAVYQTNTLTTVGEGTSFTTDDCAIAITYSDVTSTSAKADLILSNIQFVENMPTQTSMTFPDITVTPSADGTRLELAAESIVPEISNTPNPSYTITNFTGSVNPNFSTMYYFYNENVSTNFTCMGMTVYTTSRMYAATTN